MVLRPKQPRHRPAVPPVKAKPPQPRPRPTPPPGVPRRLSVAFFRTKPSPRADYLLDCFRRGVTLRGDRCLVVESSSSLRNLGADVAVQVCAPNRRHNNRPSHLFRLAAAEWAEKKGVRVLTIDTGFVRGQAEYIEEGGDRAFDLSRPSTYGPADGRVYYEVGYDGIKGRADHLNAGAPPDRWEALGVRLKPWRRGGDYVLVLGQPRYGQSSQEIDVYTWLVDAVARLRRRTGLPIRFRFHPRHHGDKSEAERKQLLARLRTTPGVEAASGATLREDLAGAAVAVAYSTNAAVVAAVEGVPLLIGSKACAAYEVGSADLGRVSDPYTPDRSAWAAALAYAQWNAQEMKSGACWDHLKPGAKRRR